MTSNQIDYYNARKKAQNDRLTRRETKRHNRAMEQAQNLSAQAAISSAAAAQSQAGTAAKRYQLEWESEYGFPYGTDRSTMDDPSSYRALSDVEDDSARWMPNHAVPQSYATKQFQIVKDLASSKTEYSKRVANLSKSANDLSKAASNTFYIVKEIADNE